MPLKKQRKIAVMGFRAVGLYITAKLAGGDRNIYIYIYVLIALIFPVRPFSGKSAITIQFTENHFVETYNPTIENTFHRTIKHKGTEYELEIIDTVFLYIFPLIITS